MIYRREIDGLRAVAVIPVILFHAGVTTFSGGFVGVDVFFVISGYLITTILLNDLANGTFSIARFYERRARRILPALFTVMVCCLPFGWAWLPPEPLQDLLKSMASVVLFLSNFYFLSQTGYFGPSAEVQPLLHTWSLAVEEQYYLLFPLLLAVLWRRARGSILWVVLGASICSLGFAEWGLTRDPDRTFFFTLSRFWELGAGSICAALLFRRPLAPNSLLGGAGLGMILTAVFFYGGQAGFPGVNALLPVGGTALIILFGGAGTAVARLLGARPLVAVGMISYSAYLWHQPLFAFARLRSIEAPAPWLMGLLAVASLALAALTWRFIEQPFRKGTPPLLARRATLFATSGAIALAFVVLWQLGEATHGFAARIDPQVLDLITPDEARRKRLCHYSDGDDFADHPAARCLQPNSAGGIDVILMGDSHSRSIAPEVQDALAARGIGSYAVSYSGCVPLPGFRRVAKGGSHDCAAFVDSVLGFARSQGVTTLVLTGRFTFYWSGARFDNGEGGRENGEPGHIDLMAHAAEHRAADDPARQAEVLQAYADGLRSLAEEFATVLVYPIPEAGWDVPNLLVKNAMFNQTRPDISTALSTYLRRNGPVLDTFDAIASDRIYPVRPAQTLCDTGTGRCLNASGDKVYYLDDDHLSRTCALLLADPIARAVEQALQQR